MLSASQTARSKGRWWPVPGSCFWRSPFRARCGEQMATKHTYLTLGHSFPLEEDRSQPPEPCLPGPLQHQRQSDRNPCLQESAGPYYTGSISGFNILSKTQINMSSNYHESPSAETIQAPMLKTSLINNTQENAWAHSALLRFPPKPRAQFLSI